MQTISNIIKGSYDTPIKLADGSVTTVGKYVQQMGSEILGAEGDVVNAFHISESSSDSAIQADTFAFDVNNPPSELMHIPSIEELGYDRANYELKALLIANVVPNSNNVDVELRLVDGSGNGVSGSNVNATLAAQNVENLVKTATAFTVSDDNNYQVDLRLITADGGNTTAALASKALLVQVIKK